VIKAVEVSQHANYNICKGVLRHPNSNKLKEILINQGESTPKKAAQESARSTTAIGKAVNGFIRASGEIPLPSGMGRDSGWHSCARN
jgi:hypothetical protein